MKAPDKLYLSWVIWGSFINTVRDPDNDTQVEYIRKDALLELINKKLQESADRLDYRTNKAYAEILDKLNEM